MGLYPSAPRCGVLLALEASSLQERARQGGYTPAQPQLTQLIKGREGGLPATYEVPNPTWRDPSNASPYTNEPTGGTIGPDPGSAA